MIRWPLDGYDVLVLAGLGLLAYGLYLILPALGWAMAGLGLVIIGMMGALNKAQGGRR